MHRRCDYCEVLGTGMPHRASMGYGKARVDARTEDFLAGETRIDGHHVIALAKEIFQNEVARPRAVVHGQYGASGLEHFLLT